MRILIHLCYKPKPQLNLFIVANNKGLYHSARMCMLIHLCYQPKPQMCRIVYSLAELMCRIVYSLAKFIYCSKQQRSISQCANVHADPSLLSAQPQMSRIVYFLAKFVHCSKQQRSISQCANAHIDPYLCYQPSPTHAQAFLFHCSYYIPK